jgi:hypothetical protein
LLTQLFFAAPLSNGEIIELLEHQRTAHSELLAYYQQKVHFPLDALVETRGEISRREMLQRLILEYSLRREQTYLNWLEQAIEVVQHLSE